MAIKRFYKIIQPKSANVDLTDSQDIGGNRGLYGNYTWYNRLVQGSASRITRYREYDVMDQDIDVARALDIIAEEMTGNNPKTNLPFNIYINAGNEQRVPSNTVVTLEAALKTWCQLQSWDVRLFPTVRTLIKYGDIFFYRPKEKNKKWIYVNPKNVIGAIVAQDDVTDIRGWHIKVDTKKAQGNLGTNIYYNTSGNLYDSNVDVFNKEEIIWYSMSMDTSDESPFGESILRTIYRVFKQKELLEDSVIIYTVIRAPERRVFYIDMGNMPPHKRAAHLTQIKDEIRQRKIPTMNGGQAQIESIYDPHPSMCLDLNTKIPLLDGRELTLQEMIKEHEEGKQNWIYSINIETGETVSGIVSWAGVTRKNTEVIKLIFNNGKELICTPDHKIPVKGRGYIEAQYLTENDSLFCSTPFGDNKIVNRIYLGKMDTGTLTIDKDHKYHSFHNFFISAGIFIRNSEDYFLGVSKDSNSRIDVLPGGTSLLQSDILQYFYQKLWRGLRIPGSYMDNTTEGAQFSDGAVGLAYIQEIKFAEYIERLQKHVEGVADLEFKKFLGDMNLNIDTSIFKLQLPAPTNWARTRQQKIESESVSVYNGMKDDTSTSKRFAKKKYLQWTEEEIILNERMLREEKGLNPDGGIQDLPKLYFPEEAESGGFEGGLGSVGGSGSSFDGEEVPDEGGEGDKGQEEGIENNGEENSQATPQENISNNIPP